MKIKTEVLPADQAESIAKAAELLRSGELVALPTETVYGIAADARNGEAVKKIFVAKGRPQDNPLIVHVTGPEMLPGLVSEAPERALGEEVELSKAILEKLPEGAVVRSPGMKYKHYAPKADVTLLNGTFEQFKAYVDAHMDQNPSCLCFTGEAEKLGVPCVEYGREGDGADQAKHIFRSLRALDEQGDGIVYARCPQKDGLSMAVYNRLIRAAAFRVIDL